jgi:hypothetical protein
MPDQDDEVKGRARGGKARADALSPERKAEIASVAAKARWSKPATHKLKENNTLQSKSGREPATITQVVLDLGVEVQRDVNGIEMGVLENGIPYLTQNGLARISGTARSVIFDIAQEWTKHYDDQVIGKDRISFIRNYLFRNGYRDRNLYIETKKDGTVNYAYPDVVCMAVLEYFAFESKSDNKIAIENYRRLATYGMKRFIYDALKYIPCDKWMYHNARVSILRDSAPDGHFIVFNEVTGLIVDLINADLTVNDKTVPDVSIGMAWSKHWTENSMDALYGNRMRYDHYYPDSYRQSRSNPQEAWAYPDGALPEFRRWFRHSYLLTKFPSYILGKSNALPGGRNEAQRIANLFQPKEIEG